MDEGKDSLGTTEARNADAFDTPVQPPTHPANSTVSSDSPADDKIISSANLTPPTPLSAPLPTDPLHPIQTVGSGRGDVVVGGREKRPLNKTVIIIILAALLLMGIIAFAVIAGSKVDRSELATAFAKYRSLIETGPEGYTYDADTDIAVDESPSAFNEEVDNPDPVDPEELAEVNTKTINVGDVEETAYSGWFFFNAAQSKLSENEKTTYFNDVAAAYKNFLSMTKHAKSDIKTELVTRAESYDEMLKLYIAVYFLESTHDKMLETLLSSGDEATAKYVEQALSKEPKNAMTKSAWEFLSDELHSWQDILGMYIASNCVADGEIDAECAARLYDNNNDFAQLSDKQKISYNGATQLAELMKANFYDQTLEISNLLGGANAE